MSNSSNKARKPKFKLGDIVYLVTGSPSMAVSEVQNTYGGAFLGTYKCQWFAGRKNESGIFPEESLTPTNPKP